ncbi:MAG: right-handed parallel beta-helix repeat-containing protein [Planctomycetota bacterium]
MISILRRLVANLVLGSCLTSLALADITVDDDGPADYHTIQEAVDHASPGETILVAPGFYPEEVVIPISVTITGSGIGATVVVPATSRPGSGPGSQLGTTAWVFRILASDVTIASITVDGDNPTIGGAIDARGGIITDFTAGTFDDLLVSGVEVKGVAYRGIYAAAGGTGHRFLSNTVRDINTNYLDSVGIFFYDAVGEARGNTVDNCSIGMGFHNSGGGTLQQNTCRNCDLGLLANGSTVPVLLDRNVIEDCDQGIQSIAVRTSVTTVGNQLSGYAWGIVCFGLGTGDNLVDGNTLNGESSPGSIGFIADSDVSPYGTGDVHATLVRNVLTANDFGVVMHESLADPSPVVDVLLSGDQTLYNTLTDTISFNVYLEDCNDDIDATWNFWGVANPNRIEESIWHQHDNPALGLVDFSNSVNLYVTVDDGGGADYTQINPAVQAAWPGATVFVYPGLYVEDVAIDRSLLLQGSGTSSDPGVGSVVRSTGFSPTEAVITTTSDDVRIENLRVDGWVPGGDNRILRGIYGVFVDRLEVVRCVVDGTVIGIAYSFSNAGIFTENECLNYGRTGDVGSGILLANSNAAVGTLGSGNTIHNGLSPAVALTSASSGTVEGNRIYDVAVGILCQACNAPTTIRGNEVKKASQGYQAVSNTAAVVFDDNTAYSCESGIALYALNTVPVTFQYNLVDGLGTGMNGVFAATHGTTAIGEVNGVFYGNVLLGCRYGVHLFETIVSEAYRMNVDLDGVPAANVLATNSIFDIYLEGCNDDIPATGNQFVTTDSAVIEGRIWHKNDDTRLGLVSFSGFLPHGPELHLNGFFEKSYTVSVIHIGLPQQIFVLFLAFGPGIIPSPWGDLLLDPLTLRVLFSGSTGALGISRVWGAVPGELPPGFEFHFQSIVAEPGGAGVTNKVVKVTR